MSNESKQEDLGSADRVQRDSHKVLSCNVGDSINVNGPMTSVQLIKVSGKRATLRLTAPRSTQVTLSEKSA